jgi:hypothetical protein
MCTNVTNKTAKPVQHRQMLRINRKLKTKANCIKDNSERTFKISVTFIVKKHRQGYDKIPDILNCKCKHLVPQQQKKRERETGYIKRQKENIQEKETKS